MDIAAATAPAPGSPNDDTYLAGDGFAAVLDGATAPQGRDSGCVHDVPWLVRRLSGHLASLLATSASPLPELLAAAIDRTRADHGGSCDLANPDSPSSTVTIVRRTDNRLDYLVLGDSPLVLRGGGRLDVVVDDRVDHLPGYTYDTVARLRNHPDGFWVASTDATAAFQALTGSAEVDTALLLTDGVSRLVERHEHGWPDLLATAEKAGPRALLAEAHAADAAVPVGKYQGKRFDDATAVLCHNVIGPRRFHRGPIALSGG